MHKAHGVVPYHIWTQCANAMYSMVRFLSFSLLRGFFAPTRGQNTPARCAISLPLNTRNYRPIAGWQYGLMFALCRYRSIRAHVRPMSLSLHTGSCSPYVAIAPYGLMFALCRYRSIRALALAMCSRSLRAYASAPALNSLSSSIFGVYSFDRADRTSDIGSKSGT